MCVYIHKPSNPEHTEWYGRFSINVVFSLFPEALAKHITFKSEMNYCSNTGIAGWSVMACCFTGSQIWWSNGSSKSLKQQTSIISKRISNNYSKSQSQEQMLVFHTYCPKIMLWKHHGIVVMCSEILGSSAPSKGLTHRAAILFLAVCFFYYDLWSSLGGSMDWAGQGSDHYMAEGCTQPFTRVYFT